jgi:hypothetical protein
MESPDRSAAATLALEAPPESKGAIGGAASSPPPPPSPWAASARDTNWCGCAAAAVDQAGLLADSDRDAAELWELWFSGPGPDCDWSR